MIEKILVVVGMPASGKNLGKEYADANNVPHLATGDIVRAECAARSLEPTAENASRISLEFKDRGEDYLTQLLVDRLKSDEMEGNCAMVEGMRSVAEINLLRGNFEIAVCAFIVDGTIRRQRYLGRGRPEDDPDYFDRRDRRELGYGVGDVIATADYYVLNNGTMEESRENFRKIAESFFG